MNAIMQPAQTGHAPGAPGIAPTWCSSAKEMVGCALGPGRLWFTIGGGIINEVYFPRVDTPQIRDLGFIVADDDRFWIEVKRLGAHVVETAAPGVPAVTVTHRHARFTLIVRITPDPVRDVLLIDLTLDGDPGLRLYALLAPHLGGTGNDNSASVERYRGRTLLWAEQGPFGLALAAADPRQADAWRRASAGYVGVSDGWQDFAAHGAMRWRYTSAGPGNVALMGELPCRTLLALGLGSSKEAAATLALSALAQDFDAAWQRQVDAWQAWHAEREAAQATPGDLPATLCDAFRTSAMVLRVHQDRIFPGAMVASLSVPWGNARDERGGYHLVWPRDMVECAGALLAIGAVEDAQQVLRYLIASQNEDGHWYQNQWLGGKPFWWGVQLDEAAFPVLLATTLAECNALNGIEVGDMVTRALRFIVCNGPASDQDRWEEDAGVNTFTVAACIAALVAGAPLLAPPARDIALAVADYWNAQLEAWTVVRDSALTERFGVQGYYVRVAPAQALLDEQAIHDTLPIKNRAEQAGLPAAEQVGTDFLQLVRFGLRRADDPVVRDTLKVMDGLLRVDTPSGVSWYRYNGDGYGEHADGAPFDGAGQGRAWPLLTGERGHYEVAAGDDALPYLQAMVAMSSGVGMMPEQIWDREALPERALFPGRPSGSAMPLAWTHAEFIKLVRTRELGRPFDRPEAVWRRYQGHRPQASSAFWCEHAPIGAMAAGMRLMVCLRRPGIVHWSTDDWRSAVDTPTRDSGLGLQVAELPVERLGIGERVMLTYRYGDTESWVGRDYRVKVVEE